MNDKCMRVRTIKEAVKYFKEKDPNTALRESTIRRLIKSGAIPAVYQEKASPYTVNSRGELFAA